MKLVNRLTIAKVVKVTNLFSCVPFTNFYPFNNIPEPSERNPETRALQSYTVRDGIVSVGIASDLVRYDPESSQSDRQGNNFFFESLHIYFYPTYQYRRTNRRE